MSSLLTEGHLPSMDLSGQVRKTNASYFALGPQSDIFTGEWVVQSSRDQRSQVLALKVLRGVPNDPQVPNRVFHKLLSRAQEWRAFSHQNIVPVYGIAADFGHMPCLVMPLFAKGSIVDTQSMGRELDIVHDIAEGLKFLHSQSVVHGNVKGSNILIRGDGVACLTDYDLASIMADVEVTSSNIAGTARWAAPEILDSEEMEPSRLPYSTKSDVYAFAMTIIEIYTGKSPFQHIKHDSAVIFRVLKGDRPERPTHVGVTDKLWNLIVMCWAQKDMDRPNMNAVIIERS